MTEPVVNPHDKFFKQVFSRQEVTSDFLSTYLPTEIAELLDFSSLELSKDSFIDDTLKEHFSDLLYKVTLVTGEPALVYVLFEHKSYSDPSTAFQLLRYMVRIWEQSLAQSMALSPIIPVVVYHGQAEWKAAKSLARLVRAPIALGGFVPDYHYWLFDLSQFSDDAIRGQVMQRVTMQVLKHVFRDDLATVMLEIVPLLRELVTQRTGLEYLETLLRYLSQGTDKITEQELDQVVQQVFSEGGTTMPSLAEKWIEQGRQQGLEQGLQQGLQQGLLASIELGLELRFGNEGLRLLAEVRKIEDVDILYVIKEGLKLAETPQEIQRIYH